MNLITHYLTPDGELHKVESVAVAAYELIESRLRVAERLLFEIEDCPFDWGRAPEGLQRRLYEFLTVVKS